jgi:hypothetical protein
MKKFRLLLLDANVVIEVFRQGIWDRLIEACDVHLAQTIVSDQAHFYKDDQGTRTDFDLEQYCKAGKVSVFNVMPSELTTFLAQFDPTYLEKLHPGETESLAYLVNSNDTCLICSADAIVYRVLGNLNRGEQGISLEEILQKTGLGRQLSWAFTKAFQKTWTKKGFQERVSGTGHQGNRS